jgi:hypothetical protein
MPHGETLAPDQRRAIVRLWREHPKATQAILAALAVAALGRPVSPSVAGKLKPRELCRVAGGRPASHKAAVAQGRGLETSARPRPRMDRGDSPLQFLIDEDRAVRRRLGIGRKEAPPCA